MRLNTGDSHTTNVLLNLCDELFALILCMQQSKSFGGDDKTLYDKITGLFKSMEEKAKRLKIDIEDIDNVKLALSTFIDEVIWDSQWAFRRSWESRLQRLLLPAATGGNVFFENLDEIRKKNSKTGVLEVYYMCLMLGFEGKFVGDQKGLQEYIESLRKELNPQVVKKLSPEGSRQETSIIRRGIPWWGKIVTWVLCIILPALLFIILKIFMGQAVEELLPPLR